MVMKKFIFIERRFVKKIKTHDIKALLRKKTVGVKKKEEENGHL